MKTKTFKGCTIKFSITIKKEDTEEALIAAGNYVRVNEEASQIIKTFGYKKPKRKEQIMDVELIEFIERPNENDVQKEFKTRGLLFPGIIDTLRFGAKYHEIGNLSNQKTCCIMFPHEITTDTNISKGMLCISIDKNGKRFLCQGQFNTQWPERWYFVGLKPRKKN